MLSGKKWDNFLKEEASPIKEEYEEEIDYGYEWDREIERVNREVFKSKHNLLSFR